MATIKNISELEIWSLSIDLCSEIYKLVRFLPAEEKYGLSDQLRRASVSVASNIAEGFERGSSKEFARYLKIARSSLAEISTQLTICERTELVMVDEKLKMDILILSKRINSLITHLTKLQKSTYKSAS